MQSPSRERCLGQPHALAESGTRYGVEPLHLLGPFYISRTRYRPALPGSACGLQDTGPDADYLVLVERANTPQDGRSTWALDAPRPIRLEARAKCAERCSLQGLARLRIRFR